MRKTTVYLTTAQNHALERASKAERRSKAALIREGIEAVAARYRTAEPRIPLFKSGIPDLASRVDDYLIVADKVSYVWRYGARTNCGASARSI